MPRSRFRMVSKATSPGHESYGTVPVEDKPQMRREGQTTSLTMLCQDHGEVSQETSTLTHFFLAFANLEGEISFNGGSL